MTNKQRRILEDAEISSELMHEVDHYLKDVGAVLSGTIHEKENYLTMLCNDIAEFVEEVTVTLTCDKNGTLS